MKINATLTFDKQSNDDLKALSDFKEYIFSYNLMSMQFGGNIVPSEQCDCGDTIELRFNFDFDIATYKKMNEKMMSCFGNSSQFNGMGV